MSDPGHEEACRLADSLKGDPNFTTVGVTTGADPVEIIIYVKMLSRGDYPETYEGFPVKVKKMGNIQPAKRG